ncbi:MAG: substrate-binding domain-containing protein [Paludibacter sp.]|nr:substrate-binding domain-containing protein [Paludibacter sp.]
MKKFNLVLFVFAMFCVACEKQPFVEQPFVDMSDITMENYPRVDGSTSTNPLNYIVAAKLLGLEYEWTSGTGGRDVIFTNQGSMPWDFRMKFQCSQTHGAIINLIDNQTDLIIVARKMSADEKQYAGSAGVSLIETPIALDALDFILNAQNSVNSLLVGQIQNIYLGNITNWNEVGGADEEIIPFIRNANSGSQEMMNEIVMNNTGMPDWTVSLSDAEDMTLWSMTAVYEELLSHPNGICFTPHYYREYMVNNIFTADKIKTLAVNGIMSDKNSIKNNTYPFVANVYVSVRSDLDKSSMAYKLYKWLQTSAGKAVIAESGYVPK